MNVLRPLPIDEFVKLASSSGLEISRDDLEQLERRRLLQPYESGSFGRLHLYLLAVYFEAILVHRHPWAMKAGERSLDEVKELADRVSAVMQVLAADEPGAEASESIGRLAAEMERYLVGIDPFGPIAGIIDILRPEVLGQLRGAGRLYAELRATAAALADAVERFAPALEAEGPHTLELGGDEEDSRATVELDVASLVASQQNDATIEEEPEPVVVEVSDAEGSEAEESEAEESEAEESEAEEPTPPPVVDEEEARITSEIEETAQVEEEAEEEVEAEPASNANGFSREESATGRTRALLDRLEQIKAQRGGPEPENENENENEIENAVDADETQEVAKPAAPVEASQPATLQEKVNELNLLREQLIRAQDWGGLIALYEQRIDLFEDPADCQQVLLTLATLYELKLSDIDNALRCFHEAFVLDVEAGQRKALESLRKIGSRPAVAARWRDWLEEHVAGAPATLRGAMQRDLASAQAAEGRGHHAFLSYAAYLAEDPDTRIDAAALDFLDDLSLGVEDDEVGGFFDGVLEHATAPAARCLVALRAGMFFLGRNEPHHAIRCFRIAFEADPSSDIAFSNLSRLYEKEENWGDLRAIIARKLSTAQGEEAERLRRELGRVVENELSTEEAIARFGHELEKNPNDEHSLTRLVQSYEAMDRFVDAYGHLNRLLDNNLAAEQEVRVRKHLAAIASEHLFAPEEAGHHFQRALELNGPEREILEGLANVRLSAGEWSAAIATLKLLTNGELPLGGDRRKKWLNAGIEAARQADRPEDLRHFQDQLTASTSSAS